MSARRRECMDENSVVRIKPGQLKGVRMYYPIVTKSTQFPVWFGLSAQEAEWAKTAGQIHVVPNKSSFEADDTGTGGQEAAERANRAVKFLCDAKFSAELEKSNFPRQEKVRLKE